ncbi:MAG: DUF2155 domain-containing protein [Mariprofundus sp.]|nr:DUF2155 domain-containing protein [Mariprofundus sp.]
MKQLALIAIALLMLSACEQKQPDKIQWQLPLQAPDDPHGGNGDATVPEWASAIQGEAEVVWLQKNTTRRFTTKLVMGGSATVQNWEIRLLGLASGLRVHNKAFLNDENVDNPAAFVEVSRNGKTVYRGWLYKKFPELFGMDDPEWKIWLKGITLRPVS